MKLAIIAEAVTSLKKPKNLIAISIITVLSALCIYFFGYVQFQRLIIPCLILTAGILTYRIGWRRLQASSVTTIIRTGSRSFLIFGCSLIIGTMLDVGLFGEIGQIVVTQVALMWLWAVVSLSRLDRHLNQMPDTAKQVLTQSADVVIARLAMRHHEIQQELIKYQRTREKMGLPPHKSAYIVH